MSVHPSRKVLEDWLESVGAGFQWCEYVDGFGTLQLYRVNGRPFIVHSMQTKKHDFGWEIYIPATDSNVISATLEAAAEYLRVVPKPAVVLTTVESIHFNYDRTRHRPEFNYTDQSGTKCHGVPLVRDLVEKLIGRNVEPGDRIEVTVRVLPKEAT